MKKITALIALTITLTLAPLTATAAHADDLSPRDSAFYTGPCIQEDDDDCYWDAKERGNGIGKSYWVSWSGVVHYTSHKQLHHIIRYYAKKG